ncbi:dihydrolipoyl dehydrogenase [Blochmannia endosymbiont of Colobopsis nipponica]|uniref:dihydrolipoyl dehydrogenase n=1 Tax=Blochmannia endosymbiont of Colobopsis nipponica TaxID=2681987 RepID=UPI0017865225|nr:dihydrolipoyl dehydrogenase [Blochmannia endosymbiont of Colobopsis nipponica]QOI11256.1 dihydrolipoyl dehydrogenase [Blochmannia endosymbiont of Colobopsis nipponica]
MIVAQKIKTQVVVLGAGPGGYSAAFRCADLGKKVILVENYSNLGGVCLNVGCIPSKTLLHFSKLLREMKLFANYGLVSIDKIQINFDKLLSWKKKIIDKLAFGLNNMSSLRKIRIIHGYGKFIDSNVLRVESNSDIFEIYFDYAIIATGSQSMQLSCISYNDSRIWNSTDALKLQKVPDKLLIVGAGVIGLEMATIYSALGSKIDLVEISENLIPILDDDIIKIFTKCIRGQFNLILGTKITMVSCKKEGIFVSMKKNDNLLPDVKLYDGLLVAIGRTPNSRFLGVDLLGVKLDSHGFIVVNKQMCTSLSHIFAVGDVVGQPMLAHKSIYEGHVAAEVIAGLNSYFDPKVIPFVIYTDPELAWVGLTEKIAQEKNISHESAVFPWLASGRAVSSNYQQGVTKLLFDKSTHKIIGGTVIGTNSSELLGEIGLAIEMGCDAEDISMTMHAHPTLYESIGLAASIYEGSITDILNIKARSN